jgi:hypothetical protein
VLPRKKRTFLAIPEPVVSSVSSIMAGSHRDLQWWIDWLVTITVVFVLVWCCMKER